MSVVPSSLLAAILVALVGFMVSAGQIEPLPGVLGRWRTGTDDLAFAASYTTRAERAAFLAALPVLIGPFKRLPVLNPPRGFDVRWYRSIRGSFYAQGRRAIPGGVRMQLFHYLRFCPTCPAELTGEAPAALEVVVNSIDSLYGDYDRLGHDEGGGIYYEPQVVGEVAGFKRYSAGVVISRSVSLFVPVTRARFLRNKIAEATAEVRRWARVKRKDAHDMTKERLAQEALQALETELASMAADVRDSQAWCCNYLLKRPSILAEPSDRGARPLVATNWAYFDRTKPRTAFQIIIMGGHTPTSPPHLVRAYDTVWQTLDWSALAALLVR